MHDLTCTTVRELALDTLEPAPENVRTAPPEAAALAELKASLAAHGLLASLVVRPVESVRPRYAVVAGGRRLAALKALAAEGVIPVNHPVPCRVDGSDIPPGELSLAENVVRVAMHPADQAQAFGRLAAGAPPWLPSPPGSASPSGWSRSGCVWATPPRRCSTPTARATSTSTPCRRSR